MHSRTPIEGRVDVDGQSSRRIMALRRKSCGVGSMDGPGNPIKVSLFTEIQLVERRDYFQAYFRVGCGGCPGARELIPELAAWASGCCVMTSDDNSVRPRSAAATTTSKAVTPSVARMYSKEVCSK